MADKPETPARLCGRLWATLVVLRAVGEDRGKNTDLLDESWLDKVQKQPGDQLDRQLALAARYLRKARRRGARHGEAGTRLFLAIPEYVPQDGRFPRPSVASRRGPSSSRPITSSAAGTPSTSRCSSDPCPAPVQPRCVGANMRSTAGRTTTDGPGDARALARSASRVSGDVRTPGTPKDSARAT